MVNAEHGEHDEYGEHGEHDEYGEYGKKAKWIKVKILHNYLERQLML